MCLIAYSECKENLPENLLRNARDHNSDGYGIMFADGRDVRVTKSMGDFDDFLKDFNQVPSGHPVAVHFRFATAGGKKVELCHPFKVLDRAEGGISLYMMHNGTFSEWQYADHVSDTQGIVDLAFRPVLLRCPGLIRTKAFGRLVEAAIGDDSKLLFMEGNGNTHFINDDWHEEKNVNAMFSNAYSLRDSYSNWPKYGYVSRNEAWREIVGDYSRPPYYGAKSGESASDSQSLVTPETKEEKINNAFEVTGDGTSENYWITMQELKQNLHVLNENEIYNLVISCPEAVSDFLFERSADLA